MTGHRRYRRRRSSKSSSSDSIFTSTSMRTSAAQTDDDARGGHRRRKRSSDSLPVRRSPASLHHSWVLLNRAGARLKGVSGDPTMSATSRTSEGEEITVSFELVEPPGTSVLTFHWPRPKTTPRWKPITANVIAAHRDVVLLAITSIEDKTSLPDCVTDLFVYQASLDPSRCRRSSLLLLPSAGGGNREIGIMSSGTSNDDVDGSPSFVVAELRIGWEQGNEVSVFRSASGQWESFKNLHVHGANGGRDLEFWSTDAVVPYGRRRMIWVDYYRGMVIMDLPSQSETTNPPPPPRPPRLRYVALPVDSSVGDPEDAEWGRACPKASRSVCVTRHGVKFVTIDTQRWSNFGVGYDHMLTWSHRFRITTWSLREEEETWRKDVTMHEQEFWDVVDGGDRDRFRFPHVEPRFPVVDVDNPDVVIFRLEENFAYPDDRTKWMIEVDLRKKVLLAATAYSKSNKDSDGLSRDARAINSARREYSFEPIPSELSRYLDGRQACKKMRRNR